MSKPHYHNQVICGLFSGNLLDINVVWKVILHERVNMLRLDNKFIKTRTAKQKDPQNQRHWKKKSQGRIRCEEVREAAVEAALG